MHFKPPTKTVLNGRRTVAQIQRKAIKHSKRNAVSQLFHAKNDKETIASWKADLNRILHVFNVRSIVSVWLLLIVCSQTELAINTHVIVSDVRHGVVNTHTMVSELHRNMVKSQEGTDDQHRSVSDVHNLFHNQMTNGRHCLDSSQVSDLNYQWIQYLTPACSIPGELPPPSPRAFFGRDELIETIVGLVQNLTPVALIGAGGIGKTSVALTVLHNNHIKQQFGDDRRFIRCDQFPASCSNFLHRLSKAIGAGIENPEDLIPLRPFLSSKEILIVLDNAESILDPQTPEIYAVVEELSQFSNVCLCITSRISIIPPDCKTLNMPTLSVEAAHNAFYHIYTYSQSSDLVDNILEQLDFHPLSVTLLATVAQHNQWDTNRLTKEWERQRTGMLHVQHNKSLSAAIELSLSSPMFQELGPNAHGLLEVVAFFPQGVDENNLDWLFPTIPDRRNIFDKFCILSLTYRSNGFITMLAPLQDHLCPKNPMLAPLLCMTKENYFSRLSVAIGPGKPGFEEAQWIRSEDVNIEHLLNVFTTIDANSGDIWDACIDFMRHLFWHKPQLVMLKPKIEGLPDDHPSKPRCLFHLSRLFYSVGNNGEYKQLLVCTLELWRCQGNKFEVANTLKALAQANRMLNLYTEGIQQVKEAQEIYKQLKHTVGQAQSLTSLAYLLSADSQLNAAEEAAFSAINLLSDQSNQFMVCECYRVLGNVCRSKGEKEKAINHYEAALGIASSSNWHEQLFWIHHSLAQLFHDQGSFDDAHIHVKYTKSHTANDKYLLGRAMEQQAWFWYKQQNLKEAKSEALCAVGVYEKFGASKDMDECRKLLQKIEEAMNNGKFWKLCYLVCLFIIHS